MKLVHFAIVTFISVLLGLYFELSLKVFFILQFILLFVFFMSRVTKRNVEK
jgi:hypothetical protein